MNSIAAQRLQKLAVLCRQIAVMQRMIIVADETVVLGCLHGHLLAIGSGFEAPAGQEAGQRLIWPRSLQHIPRHAIMNVDHGLSGAGPMLDRDIGDGPPGVADWNHRGIVGTKQRIVPHGCATVELA